MNLPQEESVFLKTEALTLIITVEARTSRDGLRKSEGKRLQQFQNSPEKSTKISFFGEGSASTRLCLGKNLSASCKRFCCLVVKSSIAAKTALYLRHKCRKYQSSHFWYWQFRFDTLGLLPYTHFRSSRCILAKATSVVPAIFLYWSDWSYHFIFARVVWIHCLFMYVPGNAEESTFAHNRLRWCQRRRLGLLFEQGPTTSAATLRFTLHSLAAC